MPFLLLEPSQRTLTSHTYGPWKSNVAMLLSIKPREKGFHYFKLGFLILSRMRKTFKVGLNLSLANNDIYGFNQYMANEARQNLTKRDKFRFS